ncbi:MAG: hypothetical protein H9535_11790 [Ignavibacteria bacterium]|nr:hypothetical protein [Ignavibacteria bacterium]
MQKENERIQRLQTLADLWGKFYLFHPNIIRADKPIDWHAAVEKAIPAVESARIPDEFVSVLNTHFFKILNAPDAFAFKLPDSITSEEWWKKYNFSLLDSGEFVRRRILPRVNLTSTMVYIDAAHATLRGNPMDTLAARYLYDALQAKKNNDTLIIDLRIQDERYDIYAQLFTLRCFTPVFTIGSSISRAHRGWNENMKSMTWQGQKWIVNPMHTKTRALWGSKVVSEFERRKFQARSSTVIFLVNKATLAFLRDYCAIAKGNANVTMILDTTDNAAVRSVFAATAAELYPTDSIGVVAFTDILQAQGVMFGVDGMSDSTITDVRNTKRFADVARAILLQKEKKPTGAFSLDTRFVSPDTIPAQGTPQQMSRESRLRGLFKVWTVVKYLYPHLKTAGVNWDSALTRFIPRIESVRTSQDYYLVMQEFSALLKDSHTQQLINVNYQDTTALLFPFNLKKIGNSVIVGKPNQGRWLPDSVITTGSEIVGINGQTIQEFESYWRKRIPASTEQAFLRDLYFIMDGVFNSYGRSSIELSVQTPRGVQSVQVPLIMFKQFMAQRRKAEVVEQAKKLYGTERPLVEMLSREIGYIKLFSIPFAKEKFLDSILLSWEKSSEGIILDLRGYPQLNYRVLLSKFLQHPTQGAIYSIPYITPRQSFTNSLLSMVEDKKMLQDQAQIEPHPTIHYTKPIVALISEDLQSQAEDFCIFLKNAHRCTFVGTPTTGANGTIAYIFLPGGKKIGFTGEEVRYPDGTPFQRIGILPDVKVSPSVNGIRAGRDEVLEKGVEVLQALLKQSSTPAQSSPRK